jgi:hypothetical protein
MLFLVCFALLVAAVCAPVLARAGREPAMARPWRSVPPSPASREGVLAERLLAGEITRRQYARAMERLAR